ncbi:hypothetical protein BDR26DRAFT_853359 [Obelidium mucronatum]|nr:hypothetical protein BDR26DRAFT_853359 [Obelidium mucronatum]
MFSKLPPELLVHIFGFLDFGESFPVVSTVSHSWRITAFTFKVLSVDVASGDDSVVDSFSGHRSIKSITSNSSRLIEKALKSSPNLSMVNIQFSADEFDGTTLSRDVGHLLRLGKKLACIYIENPDFILQRNDFARAGDSFVLEKLVLQSMSNEALDNFPLWLQQNRLPKIQNPSLHLPQDTFTRLSETAPGLSTLKLKYCTMAPRHILEIATHFKALKHLSIGKCDAWFYGNSTAVQVPTPAPSLDSEDDEVFAQNSDSHSTVSYSELVHFITSRVPGLLSLHINQCSFNALPQNGEEESIQNLPIKQHSLQSLKIFDVSDSHRVSEREATQFIMYFPRLTSLRIDVDCELFYNNSSMAAFFSNDHLQDIKSLELRGSKPYRLNNQTHQQLLPPCFNTLERLSLWAAPPSLVFSLLENSNVSQTLKSLCLNYIPMESTLSHGFELPNLQNLEIRAIGISAGNNCTRLLDSLTISSPNLKTVELGSFKRGSDMFPGSCLLQLSKQCPQITALKLTNFKLSEETLMHLTTRLLNLERLIITGCQAINVISTTTETRFLFPFLTAHRNLNTLEMSVGGIDTREAQVGTSVVGSKESLQLAIQGLGFHQRSTVIRQTRLSDVEVYKLYGKRLCERFRWLKNVTILGPLSGADLIHE